ncbi:MAG: Rieske (2Fe-2S) protein [Candidatus Poribacteria bacterium]|nr:Rieske (2Fe-2S) protein [Candidatus Poribacteria bacterium]MYK20205.1 Rieske (2Fe-2S) protein [Candidatus Poribacteria bacterium]
MPKYVVATADEIPVGERKIIEIGGRSIGVFNIDGEYYAIRNSCPHQGGPLCSGLVTGFLESSGPGNYNYTRKGEILRCPWHSWEFDIKTGQSWWSPAQRRVRKYEVHVESGEDIEASSSDAEPQKGPYVADTFPVTVEQKYVVIEID